MVPLPCEQDHRTMSLKEFESVIKRTLHSTPHRFRHDPPRQIGIFLGSVYLLRFSTAFQASFGLPLERWRKDFRFRIYRMSY